MKILIAEDELISRCMLEEMLRGWGHEVVVAGDGLEALQILQQPDAPKLAILDWKMPRMDGIDVCRHVRTLPHGSAMHLILLTGVTGKHNIVAGLEAGADDYITKPYDQDELKARLNVGVRLVELQGNLSQRVQELEVALARVKQLQGLLPICCYCKKIRDDQNYWQQVETYISAHADVMFSHGICPDCLEKVKREFEQEMGVK